MSKPDMGSEGFEVNEVRLDSPDIQDLIRGRIEGLRKRLLDFSRRNPLVDLRRKANSTSNLWVVDELPDVLRFRLSKGGMTLKPLPPLDEDPLDEQEEDLPIGARRLAPDRRDLPRRNGQNRSAGPQRFRRGAAH